MNSEEDLCDTGSVTIEGGWYTDSSSQGSQEEIAVDNSVANQETNNDEDGNENLNEETKSEEETQEEIQEEEIQEEDENVNQETCLLDSESNRESDSDTENNSDTENVSESSYDSVNGKQSGERLIIHPDIETAKVSLQ